MAAEPALSVVVPCYNEAGRVGPTVARILAWMRAQPTPMELLVVADGCSDGTAATARAAAAGDPRLTVIEEPHNHGKGWAVRRGMAAARGQELLFSDADLSTPIEEVDKLRAALAAGHQVAIASRGLRSSQVTQHQPWWRERMGRTFNWFVQALALPGIHDSQCGFKLFTRAAADVVFPRQTLPGFGFDVEILWIARKHGFRIAEVPVVWVNNPLSKVHPVRDATRMLLDLLRVRRNDRRGCYR